MTSGMSYNLSNSWLLYLQSEGISPSDSRVSCEPKDVEDEISFLFSFSSRLEEIVIALIKYKNLDAHLQGPSSFIIGKV